MLTGTAVKMGERQTCECDSNQILGKLGQAENSVTETLSCSMFLHMLLNMSTIDVIMCTKLLLLA